MTQQGKESYLTRNYLCMFMVQLCLVLVLYTLMSTMTEYAAQLGATTTTAGLVSGVYLVGAVFSRIYSGCAMQKYGRRQIALIFCLIHLAASLLYRYCSNMVLLILIRFLHGLGFGATVNAAMLIVMSEIPKSRYGEGFGIFMLSTSLGVAVGPYIGGLIYDHFGGTGCFTAASIISFVAVACVLCSNTRASDPYYTLAGGAGPAPQKREPLNLNRIFEKKALPISLCVFCLCFGYAALMSFHRLYAQSTNLTKEFSHFFLIYAAVLLVSRPVVGKLQDRVGDNIICYPCMLGQVLGLTLLAWRPCMITIVVCAVLGAMGYGTLCSVLNVVVNRQVEDDRRSYAITTYWAFSDFGLGIAPMLLGSVAAVSNYHILYFAAALISLCGMPIYWLSWGRKQKKNP